jgi:hypothetical protein
VRARLHQSAIRPVWIISYRAPSFLGSHARQKRRTRTRVADPGLSDRRRRCDPVASGRATGVTRSRGLRSDCPLHQAFGFAFQLKPRVLISPAAGNHGDTLHEIKDALCGRPSSCKTVSMIFAVFDLENPAFAQETDASSPQRDGARYQRTRRRASQTLLGGNAMAKRPARRAGRCTRGLAQSPLGLRLRDQIRV